jgi:acetyl-CoA carboxylase biotin carboxyl carrier protein
MAIIDVKAEITGNVWKVLAKPGQKVEEDEPIVMLESMKMEIPVSAPEPGTVKEILVAEGGSRHRGKRRRTPRSVRAWAIPVAS